MNKYVAITAAVLAWATMAGKSQAQIFSSDWKGANGSTGNNDYSVVQENNAAYNYNNWHDEVVGNGTEENSGFAVTSLDGGAYQVATLTYDVGVKVSPPLSGFDNTAGYGDGYSINFGPSLNGDNTTASGALGTSNAELSPYNAEPNGLSIQVHTYGSDGNYNNALINWDGTELGQINDIGASGTQDWVDFNTSISATGLLTVEVVNATTSFDTTKTFQLSDWTTEDNSKWGYTIAAFSGGAAEINEVGNMDIVATPEPSTWALMLGGLGLLVLRLRRQSKA